MQPRQLHWKDKEECLGGLEKRFAALLLDSLALSDRSSLDFCGFMSPLSKASSEESARALVGSYHLSANVVPSVYNIRRVSDSIQKKKHAKAAKRRRGLQTD